MEGTHLDENELFDLRRSLETISNIVRFLNRTTGGGTAEDGEDVEYAYPTLQELTKDVRTFPAIVQRIDQLLDKYGKICDNASAKLLEIRRELTRTEDWWRKTPLPPYATEGSCCPLRQP